MRLSDWANITGGELRGADVEITRMCTDTRSLKRGDIFFALKGANFDAHEFLPEAEQLGALAAVVERVNSNLALPQLKVSDGVEALGQVAAAWRQRFTGPMVAVTGSCGKTTVKGMLQAIFAQAGPTLATRGNLNNHLGVPITLFELQPEHQFAVIEMGASGRNEIAYLTDLARPSIALVNNVQAAHIEGFGSLDGVKAEKLRIYDGLGPEGVAVLNLDDPYASDGLRYTRQLRQLGFSLNPSVALSNLASQQDLPLSLGYNSRLNSEGLGVFDWHMAGQIHAIELAVLGKHNLANALAAASCAWSAGVEPQDIIAGLRQFRGEKGRMQPHRLAMGAFLVDDTYNANPGSVAAAIDYLAERPGRRLLVLGDMKELGSNAWHDHRDIGALAAAKGIDGLWLCGELCLAAAEGFGPHARHFPSQTALLESLQAALLPGDTLLIKGSRSSRMENLVNGLLAFGEST